ncbi:glycoside hydrolase family 36 protein [Rathayibacter soli]|uniref:glycoside hydrolase family 36 protein n=1 Tax=Rathayibacter soli TaxID=3144168 RepID=UPI0027E42577|nr:alpha-galactosidase [Glaciibacter superstes]
MTDRLRWGNGTATIEFEWSETVAPRIAAMHAPSTALDVPHGLPLIDVLTVSQGHALANDRLVHTVVGQESRYLRHRVWLDGVRHRLEITVRHDATGLESTICLSMGATGSAIQSHVSVANGGAEAVVLRSVPSFSSYLGGDLEGDHGSDIRTWNVHHALSDWLGEGRWITEPLNGIRFPRLEQHLTNHNPRGEFSVVSTGTWSTGKHLPVAAVASERLGAAWAWQIEHNGPWRWEIGEDTASGYFALSGPTDTDHQWTKTLAPGAIFETVPVTVALACDVTTAIAALTQHRRTERRAHPDNQAMPIIFNDYMNTLNGDPTTEKLLPLVDAAAAVGAEIFCIDAGWYDNTGEWWDSVGEWMPSSVRFPNGLSEVTDHIAEAGMVPGLWLEPEVIGVNSPMASRLPDGAFLQREGMRLVEHHRYHLDLRHPAARAHLDAAVDRLIAEFGIGFFKLDYNINPGPGTDYDTASVGEGLLEHNRAHLAWIDGILDRHPTVVLENCASGGMRADFAMLSRFQMQSTSDQQDFLKYPPIAAAAPMSMLPEQAASWAYPQPEMSLEEVAFCLATGLLGRFYLSGYLNRMSDDQLQLVRAAIVAAKDLKAEIASSHPFWPLGLPVWDAEVIALGLTTSKSRLITVWNRSQEHPSVVLDFPELAGSDICLHTVFPQSLPEWASHWDVETGALRLDNLTGGVGARVLRIDAVTSTAATHPATQTQ